MENQIDRGAGAEHACLEDDVERRDMVRRALLPAVGEVFHQEYRPINLKDDGRA